MEHQSIIEIIKAIGEGRYPLMLETKDGVAIEGPCELRDGTQAKVFCMLMRLSQIEIDTALESWGRSYPRGGYHYTYLGRQGELIQVAIPAPHEY